MSNSADFQITKKGVLKEYFGSEEHVVIPDGVTAIGKWAFSSKRNMITVEIPPSVKRIDEGAFYWCGNLISVSLPSGIEEIGAQAFSSCEKLEQISVPEGCTIGMNAFFRCNKLVNESGLLILQNRICNFFSEDEAISVVIPDGIDAIDDDAFLYRCPHQIEMSLHCPLWKDALVGPDGTTITFRDGTGNIAAKVVLAWADESGAKMNGAKQSIRQENHAFDFAGYDAYWAKLTKAPNKLRVALARIEYPYALSDDMRGVYEAYLTKQSLNAGKILIDEEQAELLAALVERQVIAKTALPKLVDYANQSGKTAITAALLSGQNTVSDQPAPKKTAPKSREKSLWKKPKAGTHLVGRYLGTETAVAFPTEVDGIPIEGIADTTVKTPENYKALRSVVIPEGYTTIGSNAFYGCEKLVRITLPTSLKTIRTGAFGDCGALKELYIPKDTTLESSRVFFRTRISILVIEPNGGVLPKWIFSSCQIDDLVILGGDFKSKGFLFNDGYILERWNFPKRVWVSGDFDCPDIRDYYDFLAKNVHPIAEFDESIIEDEAIRAAVTEAKHRCAEEA